MSASPDETVYTGFGVDVKANTSVFITSNNKVRISAHLNYETQDEKLAVFNKLRERFPNADLMSFTEHRTPFRTLEIEDGNISVKFFT